VIYKENNNHKGTKAHPYLFFLYHRITGIHQQWVHTKNSAALEGPILGGGIYLLVPTTKLPKDKLESENVHCIKLDVPVPIIAELLLLSPQSCHKRDSEIRFESAILRNCPNENSDCKTSRSSSSNESSLPSGVGTSSCAVSYIKRTGIGHA
jgi:hypothetical protein